MPNGFRNTFASLRNRKFRIYTIAQIGSNIGVWIQITAENWLVLQLTDSGLALGITNALQFGPLVFLGLHGGVIADRFDRRRLLIMTQGAQALLAGAVGLLVATGLIQLWMIWLAALLLGVIMSMDKPALYSFVKDLVGETDLPNAVALNNAVVSSGRMVGPAISGVLIASYGLGPSFFINAATFVIVVLVLVRLDASGLRATAPVARSAGQVREGLSYIRRDPALLLTVLAMSAIFIAVYNFQVMVPLLTVRVLDGASGLYGLVMSLLGLGAVTGSLLIASWVRPGVTMIAAWCGLLSVVHVWLAMPFGVTFTIVGVFALGVGSGFFSVTVASTLQIHARDDMRGRVMALYSMGILGSGLVGAPLAGTLADRIGVSDTLPIIAAVCAATACLTAWAWTAHGRDTDGPATPRRPGSR